MRHALSRQRSLEARPATPLKLTAAGFACASDFARSCRGSITRGRSLAAIHQATQLTRDQATHEPMTESFQKPIAAPPTIFGSALLLGIFLDLIWSAPITLSALRFPIGAAGIAGGVWLIRMSMIEMDAGNTTYDPYAISTNLVTSGIYRHIRNPGYLGLAVIELGLAGLLNSYWIVGTLAAALLMTHFFVVLREEDKLRRTFGASYDDYVASSRRWL